jgi:hypothetical protein
VKLTTPTSIKYSIADIIKNNNLLHVLVWVTTQVKHLNSNRYYSKGTTLVFIMNQYTINTVTHSYRS